MSEPLMTSVACYTNEERQIFCHGLVEGLDIALRDVTCELRAPKDPRVEELIFGERRALLKMQGRLIGLMEMAKGLRT